MSGHDGGAGAPRGLKDWADQVRVTALRDEAFWTRQRAGIRGRIEEAHGSRRRAWALALGASVAAVAAAVVLAGRGPSETVPGVAPLAVETASDGDDQLLVDVERAVMREVPLAYEAVDFQWNGARDPEAD